MKEFCINCCRNKTYFKLYYLPETEKYDFAFLFVSYPNDEMGDNCMYLLRRK